MATVTHLDMLCDICLAKGKEVPGDTVVVDLGAGPRAMELCPKDHNRLVGPLEAALEAHGVRVKAGAPTRRKHARRGGHGRQP
jgi:hypothetical protein